MRKGLSCAPHDMASMCPQLSLDSPVDQTNIKGKIRKKRGKDARETTEKVRREIRQVSLRKVFMQRHHFFVLQFELTPLLVFPAKAHLARKLKQRRECHRKSKQTAAAHAKTRQTRRHRSLKIKQTARPRGHAGARRGNPKRKLYRRCKCYRGSATGNPTQM